MIHYVTGATGFLGGRVVELLLQRGDQVIALGRNMDVLKKLEALGASIVRAELTDRRALTETIPENSLIIHCAAFTSPRGEESEFYKTNVLGTQVLSSVAVEKNVSWFIHISTSSIYSDQISKENIRESDPLPKVMRNLYAKTKLQAEEIIDQQVEIGLPAVTLRPQYIFGPTDTVILPRLIRAAKKGIIPVIDENIKVDITYIDNVVEAIFCALDAPDECIGEKYNITNGEPLNQLLFAESLLQRLGYPVQRKIITLDQARKTAALKDWLYRKLSFREEPIFTQQIIDSLIYSRTLNIEKAKNELGYRPKYSMQEGLERTIPWFARSPS